MLLIIQIAVQLLCFREQRVRTSSLHFIIIQFLSDRTSKRSVITQFTSCDLIENVQMLPDDVNIRRTMHDVGRKRKAISHLGNCVLKQRHFTMQIDNTSFENTFLFVIMTFRISTVFNLNRYN